MATWNSTAATIPTKRFEAPTAATSRLPFRMIQEFRISTSNYGADVGQQAGAIVELVTKSGTNEFHGDLHEFLRNDVLDANDWFLNRQINPPGGMLPRRR